LAYQLYNCIFIFDNFSDQSFILSVFWLQIKDKTILIIVRKTGDFSGIFAFNSIIFLLEDSDLIAKHPQVP